MAESDKRKSAKRGPGVPFTAERARECAYTSIQARARRKQVRMEMLKKLTTDLNLGEEMVKAFKAHDEAQMALIEKALRIVGLTHDQSDEGKVQKLDVKSDVSAKLSTPSLSITFKDAEKT